MSSLKKQVPNLLSLSRVFIFPPIFLYICYFLPLQHISFLYIGILAGFTDWADGYYARKWGVVSEFGKMADPIGDKISTFFIVVPLMALGVLPLWFGVVIIFRDFAIVVGSAMVMFKRNEFKVIPSKFSGKIAFIVISVTILVYYYNIDYFIPIFATLSILVFIWSFSDYSRAFFLRLHNLQT